MGEKDRRRAQLAMMSPQERAALRAERLAARGDLDLEEEDAESAEQPVANVNGAPANGFEIVQLPRLSREERSKLQEELHSDVATAPRMSTWQITKRLSRFARPYRVTVASGFLLVLLKNVMDLAKPIPLAYSVDSVIKDLNDPSAAVNLQPIIFASAFLVALALFEGLFSYIQTLVISRAGRSMTRDMRAAMFDHVQKLSLQFHARRRTGDLLLRVTSDVHALQSAFNSNLIELVNSVIFFFGMLAVMVYVDWQSGLIALAAAPILVLFIRKYSSDMRTYTRVQRRREGNLASLFNEAVGSTRLTRVFSRESRVRQEFEDQSAISLELGMQASLREERFGWTIDLLGTMLTGAIMIFAYQRASQGLLSVGELVLLFTYARQFYRPIRTGLKAAGRIWRSLAQAERVIELLDMEYGVTERTNAREAPLLRGEIEFRGVSFRHDETRAFMEDVNLKLPAKRITAIVGPTGAGKTTLVSMVPRLYDPIDGQVLIDGVDIREYKLDSLRDQISVVLQESSLLFATIAENIAYGRPDAEMADIEAAAWLAGAHEFITSLPDGYRTEVGERGETLSGGQRQLISIARALLRDAPIVILDEPMTGLDAASSAQVRDGLERLMTDKTVLFITHNLALVENADNVVVISDGKVVEQGKPRDLEAGDGLYAHLFHAQFEEENTVSHAQ